MELFARVVVVIGALALSLAAIGSVAAGHVSHVFSAGYAAHAAGALIMLAFWAALRLRAWETRLLQPLEAVALATSVGAHALGSRYLNETVLSTLADGIPWRDTPAAPLVSGLMQHYMSTVVVMAFTYIMIVRAALVPSTPRHTALLTAGVGFPVALVSGFGWVPVDADITLRQLARPSEATNIALILAVWLAFTTMTCAITSRIIHSLHVEVRAARQLGQYTLEQKIGEGGMGEVYRASHALMRRPTAIKLLRPDRADAAAVARFEREVQLTARLTHPNTITLFDYGRTPEGVFYYAMELLDGATLKDIVRADGPMPPERVIHVLRMVAGSLHEAHQLGLIHRDIKPSNIVLCERGGEPDVAKVLDFGLVKPLRVEPDQAALTRTDSITGTPLYMSPESILVPEAMDTRSDLYSVGALGYFLLTGQHVFEGRSVIEVCGHHLHSVPVAPSVRMGETIPEDLEQIVLECLEKDPERRPQSAAELRVRLDGCGAAGQWTTERAGEWWRDVGQKLRGMGAPSEAGEVSTVAEAAGHRKRMVGRSPQITKQETGNGLMNRRPATGDRRQAMQWAVACSTLVADLAESGVARARAYADLIDDSGLCKLAWLGPVFLTDYSKATKRCGLAACVLYSPSLRRIVNGNPESGALMQPDKPPLGTLAEGAVAPWAPVPTTSAYQPGVSWASTDAVPIAGAPTGSVTRVRTATAAGLSSAGASPGPEIR